MDDSVHARDASETPDTDRPGLRSLPRRRSIRERAAVESQMVRLVRAARCLATWSVQELGEVSGVS